MNWFILLAIFSFSAHGEVPKSPFQGNWELVESRCTKPNGEILKTMQPLEKGLILKLANGRFKELVMFYGAPIIHSGTYEFSNESQRTLVYEAEPFEFNIGGIHVYSTRGDEHKTYDYHFEGARLIETSQQECEGGKGRLQWVFDVCPNS